MKCEYCDSIIRNVPDNGVCPNCGALLGPEKIQQVKPPEPVRKAVSLPITPVGRYPVKRGYVELDADSVTLCHWRFFRRIKRRIHYLDIDKVTFKRAEFLESGFLCVRAWEDRDIPAASRVVDAAADDTAVLFALHHNDAIREVYDYLYSFSH